MENKTAYPYITEFKKEPFRSFVFVKRGEIGSFYISSYEKVLDLYQTYNKSLLNESNLLLENIYWFLLLRKYLKQKENEYIEEILEFIKSCEVEIIEKDQLGFKSSPNSTKKPDVWSSYFALASLKLLGVLKEYLSYKGQDENIRKIKNFIYDHKRSNGFLHCLDKECEEDNKTPNAKTLYFVIESLILLGVDVRLFKEQFRQYINDRKKDTSIIFKLLSLKFFDLDLDVKDKEIQFLYSFQKDHGGFGFDSMDGEISTTFWFANVLDIYSWLIDYNPARIYSFISKNLDNILKESESWSLKVLTEVSQLVILLSIIWHRFIEEIERVVFKRLEERNFIDLNQIKATFGLSYGIEEIILYINLNYTINLSILDNTVEFNRYLQNLSQGKKIIIKEIYNQLSKNSVISLSDIFKKYKASYHYEPLKLKEDIFPLIYDLISNHFFEGEIRTKKAFLFRTKFYLYLNFLYEKVIVSDNEINTERLYEEKAKLKEFKNDIYNMILKLENTIPQIREEIESYLLLDEVEIAKERLKFIMRDALMEADFLNENVETGFNQELIYINLQATLGSEISQWNKAYSLLQNRMNELNKYLQGRIQEKEQLKKYIVILDELNTKVYNIQDYINRELNTFKNFVVEILEDGYSKEKFDLIVQSFNEISQNVNRYDEIVYKISHQITVKEKKVVKKHRKIINNWVESKSKFDSIFADYTNGFQFFNELNEKIGNVKDNIQAGILEIRENVKNKVINNEFHDAFKIIKKEADIILKQKTEEIKDLKSIVKKEIKFKQKLYLLYKYLQEKLDRLEENIIDLVAEQVQFIKEKVIEERNRTKIEDYDNFISSTITLFKDKIENYKIYLNQNRIKKIVNVVNGFDKILIEFNEHNKKFSKKLIDLKGIVDEFEENSITTMQWNKFKDFLSEEITKLKEEYVDNIISSEILFLSKEENTDKIDIKKLADKLDLKCKAVIPRIKNLIEISKIQGDLFEDKKELIVHTEEYYKGRELKNYVENRILKQTQESIGKFLALYDSCIKNKTLGVNLLEIQNRIDDLSKLEESFNKRYDVKSKELNVDEARIENMELKKGVNSIISNDRLAIENIKQNLTLFNELLNFISNTYNVLQIEIKNQFDKLSEDVEKIEAYEKMKEILESRKEKVERKFKQVDEKIEEKLNLVINNTYESRKFETEAREFYIKKKNESLKKYEEKVYLVNEQINTLRFETCRGKLLIDINRNKIHLSQLLGSLQARVEDYIETEQFKRAYLKVNKRKKNIEQEIKDVNKRNKELIKEFNKQSNNFETKNKHIIDDFDRFIKEFSDILREKVKSLEELVIKSYVEMAIKAVSNEFLTLSFLQNELKIKKQQIQKHLISLISAGKLNGKYDPQIGLYYENFEVLNMLDEKELEVIKKMNFRVYIFIRRLKNFTNQYGSIIAFFASILTISYYIFRLSGENPITILIPVLLTSIVFFFFFFKKRKEDKI